MTSPRAELATAAEKLRATAFRGAITATPAVAGIIAARKPLALLLEAVASNALENAHEDCNSWCSPETCDLSAALAVARAINGSST
ncbi:hypothetical protein ACPESV_24565 [Streptomyces umbrinus]|uniref:hypothetical protein n=1 Tax=Streptomyces umbrinus TaxID=67370 RepID=UPI003C30B830